VILLGFFKWSFLKKPDYCFFGLELVWWSQN